MIHNKWMQMIMHVCQSVIIYPDSVSAQASFPAAVLRMEDWDAHGNFLLQLCNLDQRLAWIQVVICFCYVAQAPESLCLNVTSSIVTLIFRAQVHTSLQTLAVSQWQQFCRSLKCFEDQCYSVTARALKQDTAISDSSGSFFGGAGARRAKACERIRIHPRMSSVRSRQTAQMHMIWLDLLYILNSGLNILMHLVW